SPAGGHRGGRGRVRHSRHRLGRGVRRHPQGFPGDPGHCAGHGAHRHHAQSRHRPAVCRVRPQGGQSMNDIVYPAAKASDVVQTRRGAGRFLAWMRHDLAAAASLLFLALLILVAVLAPFIAPYSPTEQNINNMLAVADANHWLGTDDLGRDVFSRLIHGAPATLYAAVLAVSVALVIGLPVGLLAGFLGGWTDTIISRLIDTFLSFPAIVLAIAVTGALGIGLTNSMIS